MTYQNDAIGEQYALPAPEGERRRRRRWIIAIAALVVALALAGWMLARGKGAGDAPPSGQANQQIPTVSVATPGRQTVARVISATGSLAARREMPVGVAGEGGMITRVLVEPGDWVAAGQVLAMVDRSVQAQTAQSLAAQVNVTRSDATLAQAELDRSTALLGRGFISKADIDRKTATRDAANARVRVAEAQLAETRARNGRLDIRAPAAGLVLSRAAEPGQIVSSGSGVLFRMAKGGEMEMRAQLSEGDLAGLGVGVHAQVTPVGSTHSFGGEVWQVSPVIDAQSRQGVARIALAYDRELRPGGFASASITSGSSEAPQLPNSALQSDERGNFVYVLDAADKVVRRDVKIGEVSDTGVAIVAGLTGSERVVLSAGAFLNPGQKVKPILKKTEG